MPPGRPPKYSSVEERKVARNASKRESYQKNSFAILRRRKFKRNQKKTGSDSRIEEAVREGEDEHEHHAVDTTGTASRRPGRNRLDVFVEANDDSPAIPLTEFIYDELDSSPSPSNPVASCQYWQKTIHMLKGRQLGEFALPLLAIPDGELCRRRLKDFESLLLAIDTLVGIAGKVNDAAFEIDPSGTRGPVLEAKWLSRDVDLASLHLQDIVSLRRCGLESLQDYARRGLLEFQSVE